MIRTILFAAITLLIIVAIVWLLVVPLYRAIRGKQVKTKKALKDVEKSVK